MQETEDEAIANQFHYFSAIRSTSFLKEIHLSEDSERITSFLHLLDGGVLGNH